MHVTKYTLKSTEMSTVVESGGYCGKEYEISGGGEAYSDEQVQEGLQLPDTPQQDG